MFGRRDDFVIRLDQQQFILRVQWEKDWTGIGHLSIFVLQSTPGVDPDF